MEDLELLAMFVLVMGTPFLAAVLANLTARR